MIEPRFLFKGYAIGNRYNLEHYPNIKNGQEVIGYFVKSRGCYYILQQYNNGGYDERWETADWVEVYPESILNIYENNSQ